MTFTEIINEIESTKRPNDEQISLITDQLQDEFERALRAAVARDDYNLNNDYNCKEYFVFLSNKDLLEKYIIKYTLVYSSEEDYNITLTITDLGKRVLDELGSRYNAQIIRLMLSKNSNESRLIIIPIEAELPEKEENKLIIKEVFFEEKRIH
jgi:hypothetical protein